MDSLKKRLDELPEDANIADIFKVISKWEDEAVEWQRGAEARVLRKGLSGRLHPICDPFRTLHRKVRK